MVHISRVDKNKPRLPNMTFENVLISAILNSIKNILILQDLLKIAKYDSSNRATHFVIYLFLRKKIKSNKWMSTCGDWIKLHLEFLNPWHIHTQQPNINFVLQLPCIVTQILWLDCNFIRRSPRWDLYLGKTDF